MSKPKMSWWDILSLVVPSTMLGYCLAGLTSSLLGFPASEPGYARGFLDGMTEMSEYRSWLWEDDRTDEQVDSVIVVIWNKANRVEVEK